jgi:hypothetical protein
VVIDIEKLLRQLDYAGDGWAMAPGRPPDLSYVSGLCRQAAAGIRQLQATQPPDHRQQLLDELGDVLITMGTRMKGHVRPET